MHLDDDRLYVLLDRYLAGEASAAEAQSVREWLEADPEHAALLEDLRLIRRVTAEPVPQANVEGAWAKASKSLRPSRRLLVAVSGAAAGVVAGGGGWGPAGGAPRWGVERTAP